MKARLGSSQRGFLEAICRRGSWSAGGGWMWSTLAVTQRLADGLVKRGLLERTPSPSTIPRPAPVYRPTAAGIEANKENHG
jgi:DNA-binding MarR family transcriptional regulator